jgi:hypothetical protein
MVSKIVQDASLSLCMIDNAALILCHPERSEESRKANKQLYSSEYFA